MGQAPTISVHFIGQAIQINLYLILKTSRLFLISLVMLIFGKIERKYFPATVMPREFI